MTRTLTLLLLAAFALAGCETVRFVKDGVTYCIGHTDHC